MKFSMFDARYFIADFCYFSNVATFHAISLNSTAAMKHQMDENHHKLNSINLEIACIECLTLVCVQCWMHAIPLRTLTNNCIHSNSVWLVWVYFGISLENSCVRAFVHVCVWISCVLNNSDIGLVSMRCRGHFL